MKLLLAAVAALAIIPATVTAQRTETSLNTGWRFALGDAASMKADFTHGTEYFTYLSKAASSDNNRGPAWEKFDDSAWQEVTLPHDWVVDLPYSGTASHSHGYKQVGWQYPQNSVGWYRRHVFIPVEDEGRHIELRFDGIYRNAQVFCNGFYLGGEPSGYATQTYNVTEYLNYGGDNVIAVRADASMEEGWYYEGGGIYRDTWLVKTGSKDCRIRRVETRFTVGDDGAGYAGAKVETCGKAGMARKAVCTLYDAAGGMVAEFAADSTVRIDAPHLWSADTPYLYRLVTTLYDGGGRAIDRTETKTGFRRIEFSAERGMTVNGKPVKLRGSNLHLDHAGVGTGVSDGLWLYRVRKLKELGMNAIRCSHNPATPAMLDICDSLGMYVIDENRLMGTNQEHYRLLRNMIERDINHPSVVLWSIGNEEWAIESSDKGIKIAETMKEWAHSLDPSRPVTYGNSGGDRLVTVPDIHGYNYIVQNNVDERRRLHPGWVVTGTEETSGCGTRGVYHTDPERGWMRSINMEGENREGHEKNVIERGWKFYRDTPWAAGVFYWTGFDYRGEPNPMKWPATGSQFGILDYCGFPKDEAYYLKAAWTDEPVLHVFPHWNLKGQEGKEVEVWAYSNCDEIELLQDGRTLGRQKPEKDSHAVWKTVYKPGRLTARGYRNGKRVLTETVETTGSAAKVSAVASKPAIARDGQDIVVIDLSLLDKKDRLVPDVCGELSFSVDGPAEIIGGGNGNPGFKSVERPAAGSKSPFRLNAFMGHAQVIIRSTGAPGNITLTVTGCGKPLAIEL